MSFSEIFFGLAIGLALSFLTVRAFALLVVALWPKSEPSGLRLYRLLKQASKARRDR